MKRWENILGKVAFVNCDPLFHELPTPWEILHAPPSWLTGHVLRKDCLLAPIPTADFAKNSDRLQLLPITPNMPSGSVRYSKGSRHWCRVSTAPGSTSCRGDHLPSMSGRRRTQALRSTISYGAERLVSPCRPSSFRRWKKCQM